MVRRLSVLATLWLGGVVGTAAAQADPSPLLALVPDDAVAVVVVAAPVPLQRALAALVEPLPAELPDELRAQVGLGLVALRRALGGPVGAWLEGVAGGGAVLAWRPAATGPRWWGALRPTDAAAAAAFCDARLPGVRRTLRDGLLVLGDDTAATTGRWPRTDLAARAAVTVGAVAAVDLAALRDRFGGAALARQDARTFALAPIVHALQHADWLQLQWTAAGDRTELVATAAAAWPQATVVPVAAGAPSFEVLAALQLDRDVAALLREPERWLDADGVQAVRSFLSIADGLDGPRSSFVDDLVAQLPAPWSLHVLAASPGDADDDAPPIELPEFVLSAAVADERAVAVALRAAGLLATIANAERAQRGQAPFLVRTCRDEQGHGLCAEPPPWRGPGAPPTEQGLSPTLWYGGGRLALASTQRAARLVCSAAALPGNGPGDRLVLCGPLLARAITANRDVLALARMLDEGEDAAVAQRFVATFAAVADAIAGVEVAVTQDGAATRIALTAERRR
ncbi:MAG: hypothetical protein JNL08_20565 [Planctomycetes bacterium]|nr:hypothetical protein [Planctomycetota bacterium]